MTVVWTRVGIVVMVGLQLGLPLDTCTWFWD